MRFFLAIVSFLCTNILFAQKPVLDSAAYKAWPSLEAPTVNKNGLYVFYNIKNVPVGSNTIVVQSTNGKWKKEFNNGLKDYQLALSDKYFLFVNKNDSLGILTLGTDQVKYIPNTSWFRLRGANQTEYLLYSSASNPKNIILKDLKTDQERTFIDIDSWDFDGNMLVLFKSINDQRKSINLVNITTGRIIEIWEGNNPENLILDAKHHQLAFKTGEVIWYYRCGLTNAICLSPKKSKDIEQGFILGNLDSFSKDGSLLFISLVKTMDVRHQKRVVEIWSYKDESLQTEQRKRESPSDQIYLTTINIADGKIVRLQQQITEQFQFPTWLDARDNRALIENNQRIDEPWSTAYKRTWALISLKNGDRKDLNFLDGKVNVKLSPCGKYLIFFDKESQAYFSYDITAEKIRNLTEGLNVSWISMHRDDLPQTINRGIAAWLKNDKSLLVYDRYDIWQLDPLNKEKPINLTNGYGKKNEILFSYVFSAQSEKVLSQNDKIYLNGFNKLNKANGFYSKQLNNSGNPELLTVGQYLYQTNSPVIPSGADFTPPIKAENAQVYLIERMNPSEAPNYFSTRDFRTFTKLSTLQPHKKYNWYTTELHNWKSMDGKNLQGVLYKPENFDSNKKYPLIFCYYERKSDGLNTYLKPEACDGCNINIPSYVSQGYLVFCPDIYYKVGDPMQGTYDAVVSAASYISKLGFVNSKKMGIQGCSFGGYQTNYLVTHTNIFAAAESSSSVSNWISSYGNLLSGTNNLQNFYEAGQIRIGASLWEKPDAYIKNSPIFYVDKVKTPLLMMHTINDGICSYSNALEFFMGLRRMGKRTWMLVYSEGNHGVEGKEAEDFSIRTLQFFDYYLKDRPAPLWMLDNIRTSKKENEIGLDSIGRIPGPGLLTLKEQKKLDSLIARKPIAITLK